MSYSNAASDAAAARRLLRRALPSVMFEGKLDLAVEIERFLKDTESKKEKEVCTVTRT